MQADIDFLNECMELLEQNNNEAQMRAIHARLKLFTPAGMDETQCDIIWTKSWKSCTYDEAVDPSRENIRKCDMLFCKMLMKKLEYWER